MGCLADQHYMEFMPASAHSTADTTLSVAEDRAKRSGAAAQRIESGARLPGERE